MIMIIVKIERKLIMQQYYDAYWELTLDWLFAVNYRARKNAERYFEIELEFRKNPTSQFLQFEDTSIKYFNNWKNKQKKNEIMLDLIGNLFHKIKKIQ